jgi:hypothetical protein
MMIIHPPELVVVVPKPLNYGVIIWVAFINNLGFYLKT